MIDIQSLLAAAAEFKPMTNLPILNSWGSGETFDGSSTGLLNGIFELAITVGAMLAVFMFIWGGLQMITARDKSDTISKGKSKMTNAIFGLLMLLATFVVLNTINPQLTSLRLLYGVTPLKAGDTSNQQGYTEIETQAYEESYDSVIESSGSGTLDEDQLEEVLTNNSKVRHTLAITKEDGTVETRTFTYEAYETAKASLAACQELKKLIKDTTPYSTGSCMTVY